MPFSRHEGGVHFIPAADSLRSPLSLISLDGQMCRNPSRLVVVAVFLLLVRHVHGQKANARLDGRVTAADGASLPGVAIRLESSTISGMPVHVTNAYGEYYVVFLAPGTYSVTAELSGFVPQTQSATLSAQRPAVIANFKLALQQPQTPIRVAFVDPSFSVGATTAPSGLPFLPPAIPSLPITRSYGPTFVGRGP